MWQSKASIPYLSCFLWRHNCVFCCDFVKTSQLQYYMGGRGLPNLLQYYKGSEGSLGTPNLDYVINGQPLIPMDWSSAEWEYQSPEYQYEGCPARGKYFERASTTVANSGRSAKKKQVFVLLLLRIELEQYHCEKVLSPSMPKWVYMTKLITNSNQAQEFRSLLLAV